MSDLSQQGMEVSVKHVRAVQEIRRMRGACQSHLMRCSDGNYYVVKFANNPQGRRVLANELLCALLAEALSLPVAHGAIVQVEDGLVRLSYELYIETKFGRAACASGPCFGSQFPVDPRTQAVYDFLPSGLLRQVSNVQEFCGMLVFDIWTSNTDSRQAVFVKEEPNSYRTVMIDQSLSFGGKTWQLTDSPRRCLYLDKRVYEGVRGTEDFESWLTILEDDISEVVLKKAARRIPIEWFENDRASFDHLLEQLCERKQKVKDQIQFLGTSFPEVFPNWLNRAFSAGEGL